MFRKPLKDIESTWQFKTDISKQCPHFTMQFKKSGEHFYFLSPQGFSQNHLHISRHCLCGQWLSMHTAMDSCNQGNILHTFLNSSQFSHRYPDSVSAQSHTLGPTYFMETIKLLRVSKIVSALVHDDKGLYNRKSSCISLLYSYLMKASKFAKLEMSVNSSVWRACSYSAHQLF